MSQSTQVKSTNHYKVGQTWGALKKAWRGYNMAKIQYDTPKMIQYAKKIRSLQKDLGVKPDKFPELNLA